MPVASKFRSSKTYGHDAGFSCAFRQWRADSHCNMIHGYALSVRVEWEAVHLDDRNWVVDFGALKDFKGELVRVFDHKTIVAKDDPELAWFEEAERRKVLELVRLNAVGCEMFAEYIALLADRWTVIHRLAHRVRVVRVDVSEHGGNTASVVR